MKTLGILGAGQLAKMLVMAAIPLGIKTICYSSENHCAGEITEVIRGDFSEASLVEFGKKIDLLTFENENIDVEILKILEKICPVYPHYHALELTQDRIFEKNLFSSLNIPTPNYAAVDSWSDFENLMSTWAYPVLLKTRRGGYDGKGQFLIHTQEELEKIWPNLSSKSLIAEEYIQFENEASLIGVRNKNKEIRFYPLTLNMHREGILNYSVAPFLNDELTRQAQKYTKAILEALDYVGVLAVEYFCNENKLIANEIAPRVHNSGHWTINGAFCSQFENHLRALFDLPLGSTQAIAKTAMFNCIGHEPSLAEVLKISGSVYHHYGKLAKKGRKLGHINLMYLNEAQFNHGFETLKSLVRK